MKIAYATSAGTLVLSRCLFMLLDGGLGDGGDVRAAAPTGGMTVNMSE